MEDEPLMTLINMGFENVDNIKKALRLSRNDVAEAVAILTNEHGEYNLLSEDVEMQDYSQSRALVPVVPAHSPYENAGDVQVATCSSTTPDSPQGSRSFPTTSLYELEARVFTDRWSIPYKKDESLAKCLASATMLAEEGLCEEDENCRRFLEYCMPEAFNKLLTSGAVRGWVQEVYEGVKVILHFFMNLVIARLKYDPVSLPVMQVLEKVLDPETEFNVRNKSKQSSTNQLMEVLGHGLPYALSKNSIESYGWLVDLVNKFGQNGGFKEIHKRFTSNSITGAGMAALLMPFANCSELLNATRVCPLLTPCMDIAVKYVESISDDFIKTKEIFSVSELLKAMKYLCVHLYPNQVILTNTLGLEVILRMLKCPHFNARMNGLKELTKLIEVSLNKETTVKAAITSTELLEWLTENEVLSIGLEGNIDQVQYTDKIKLIIEFIGKDLSIEELTKIWNMQNGQNVQQVDNIHAIVIAASMKFQSEHFDHLLTLVQGIWGTSSDQMKKRLTNFIAHIGKESNQGKNSTKILDLLWDLSHSPQMSSNLAEHVLEAHFSILATVPHSEETKKYYCVKCIEDIQKETLVLPSIKLLHAICKNMLTSGDYKSDKGAVDELNKTYDIVKLITISLVRSHKLAVAAVGDGSLHSNVIVSNRYTHEDHLVEHLNFLQFMLQEGTNYLPWNMAKDIWDCLVTNPRACDGDREFCYQWFIRCIQDLVNETQSQLFEQKLLKLDPTKMTERAFFCFTQYFESVNSSEHKLSTVLLCVEKLDLIGVDFLWQVALLSDENIANAAIQYLLDISFHKLSAKLKKDFVSLHKQFISECYKRLEAVGELSAKTAVFTSVSNTPKPLQKLIMPASEVSATSTSAVQLQSICRLLQIAQRYVASVEETYEYSRTILPHGTFFYGHPKFLKIQLDGAKEDCLLVSHSNETLRSVKKRISLYFNKPVTQIHLSCNVDYVKDQVLVGQLPGLDQYHLIAKYPSNLFFLSLPSENKEKLDKFYAERGNPDSPEKNSDSTSSGNKDRVLFDRFYTQRGYSDVTEKNSDSMSSWIKEKQLPGYIMADGGQVFDMLYNLVALNDHKITLQARSLLHLIPCDPAVLDNFDAISIKKTQEIPFELKEANLNTTEKSVTSQHQEKIDSPKDILTSLIDPTSGVSPFKLLYNLEVLKGRLMPVVQDVATLQSAQIFRKDFLAIGGLNLILKVFEKDSIANNVNYDIHQACYNVAIDIAKFLLCDEIGLEIDNVSSLVPYFSMYSWRNAVIGFMTHYDSNLTPCSDLEDESSEKPIKAMDHDELMKILLTLMRVAWSAAAGNLNLANSPLPNKEGHFYGGRRGRENSSGSASGNGSSESCILHGGVCGQKATVSEMDSLLSRKALKFLVHCIHLRPDTFCSFSKLQCIRDFMIDLLLGSPSPEVRYCAQEEFYSLSQLKVACSPSPKHYLLQILLKAHLPLWVSSSCIRGANQRLLSQCKEYFELGCKLLDSLTLPEQQCLHIDAKQMVEDEITWLQGFSPSSSSTSYCAADDALMTGHFKFVKTLLTCEGVFKKEVGEVLMPDMLQSFLFPASHMISKGTTNIANELSLSFTPKCTGFESRVAAYDVLVELSTGCSENLEMIVKQLLCMHHYPKLELVKEFDYEPLVAGRAFCGYVGLKNAGATCYMNSVIQQLFMQPGVKEFILSVEKDNVDEESLFYQFQSVLGHLLESRLEYHVPEMFWKCFRLWGNPIDVREQQDTFEFFNHLIDQIDEFLIKSELLPIFKDKFEGIFSDQKICKGCPHRYEREESFMSLNLSIKNQDLIESLEQFVKGDILEGANSYFCEKCHEKRNTLKRTCIKKLPQVLVIHLKRFDYDWEANRAMKFNDYFKFPWQLDMLPYTTDGIQELEQLEQDDDMNDNQVVPTPLLSSQKHGITSYDLVGIIVHTGQANAGHYYSYIKERRLDSGKNFNKWFKFNDTSVEEIEMSNAMIESECFGGQYKPKEQDSSSSSEMRFRYWNAYLLFYEKTEEPVKTPRTPRKTPNKFSFRKSENDAASAVSRNLFNKSPSTDGTPYRQRDSLSQLTQLVDRGERHGLFLNKMPARIHQVVREENLRFMHNSNVYNESYFHFIFQLVHANTCDMNSPTFGNCATKSLLPMSLGFLFNTYLRYKCKSSGMMNDWLTLIENIILTNKESSFGFIEYLGSDVGLSHMKPFLLECPNRDVRQVYSRLIEKAITNFFNHGGETGSYSLNRIIVHLLDMLSQDVPDNCRHCSQFFALLCTYAQMGTKACAHLLVNNAFNKFLVFLLGPASADMENGDSFPRRWNPVQTQDFGSLHAAMALLVLNCNLEPKRTCDPENFKILEPVWASSETTIAMPSEISAALYNYGAHRYIHEVVSACREVAGSISIFIDMLIQCSFCNDHFSTLVICQVMNQYCTVPSNELKNLSHLLLEVLSLEDPLQYKRIRYVIDGCLDDYYSFSGVLSVIKANQNNDSRRSYQGVKFLVTLANKCSAAKEYLMRSPSKWQWSVSWLKKRMSERNFVTSPPSNTNLSNEDSNTKMFQRTHSAQDTLDEATALLVGVEAEAENDDVVMELVNDDQSAANCSTTESVGFSCPKNSRKMRRLKRVQAMDDLDSIDY